MGFRRQYILVALIAGCAKGPGFFKQSGQEKAPEAALTAATVVSVKVLEENGATKAAIDAFSKATQLVEAAPDSAVAGTSVAFPPGTLSVSTEVSLAVGESLATNDLASQLDLGTTVSHAGQPIAILSSVAMDAQTPFTISLAVPDNTGLHLADDPYANIAVFYKVSKAAEGGAGYVGVFTRAQITVSNGKAAFETTHFGTYQVVFTAAPILVAKEVSSATLPIADSYRYVVKGFQSTIFPDSTAPSSGGLRGGFLLFTPNRVASGSVLSTGIVRKVKSGD